MVIWGYWSLNKTMHLSLSGERNMLADYIRFSLVTIDTQHEHS